VARKLFGERWEVVEPFGEGGQAFVYKVRDLQNPEDDLFVLKRLKNFKRVDRFEKEIQSCSLLDHPGIAPILDHSLNKPAFFVTKFYDATSLTEPTPFAPLRALDLFISLCEIVAYAHSQGVIHRDLKPDNVLITKAGKIMVLDFGLCFTLGDDDRLTETMEQIGSRFYMAPELETGRVDEITTKVDTYALGKILYFLLSGRHIPREAFTGDNELSSILKNLQAKYLTDRILSVSIVKDPNGRIEVSQLKTLATNVRRLIVEHYYPGTEGSICRFCGEGSYGRSTRAGLRVHYPGIEKNDYFNIVVCDRCGNIQWFVKDK